MNFRQFSKQLKENICGVQIQEESTCHGHSVILSTDNEIFVDYKLTSLSSIEEAKQLIDHEKLSQDINHSLQEDVSYSKIANIIKEHHDVRVTDTLVESYIDLASSKLFTTDEVVKNIRNLIDVQHGVYGKIDFALNDGTSVAIDEETLNTINNIFGQEADVIEYMRESTDNFLSVVNQLEG